ncbi:MAG: sulfatase-like hydrolase/transferase, partial [candidate division WOR-3 bacterium]
VLKHSFALLALAVFIVLLLARVLYNLLTEFFSEPIRILLLLGLLGAIIFSYWWDSRFYFGLYERTVRRAIFSFDLAACLILGLALEKMLSQREAISQFSSWLRRTIYVCGLAAIIVAGVGVARLDSHEGLRALFMHRSVIARRYVNLIRWVADRDGDGFSSMLGGGDCNDRDPAVNPTAREIPGNGIDENCLGGDLAEGVLSQVGTDGEEQNVVWELTPEAKGFAHGVSPGPEGENESIRNLTGGNIALITIDALRADHLGCYGYARNTSPHIDRLASQSTLFVNAYTQATSTGHSFASLVKSSYGETVFDERRQTLMEILSRQGYETAFFQAKDIAQQLILQPPYRSLPQKGAKIEIHPTGAMQWTARDLTHQVVDYLKDRTREDRWFVWIHYLDPHRPYVAHAGFDFGTSELDLYDGEIAYLDSELQRLFAFLESPEIAEKTLIILTADHGESFREHGQLAHSSMSYQEVIRVPLIIRYPGRKPERVETPVGLIDITPTILKFAGIEVPTWYEGRDLFSSSVRARRPIFTETQRTAPGPIFFNYAMIDGDWKLIYDFVANTFELYDLKEDPGERRNLIEINREKAAELKRILTRWIDVESTQPIHSGIWSVRDVLR